MWHVFLAFLIGVVVGGLGMFVLIEDAYHRHYVPRVSKRFINPWEP